MPEEPESGAVLGLLERGELEIIGRLPGASNATFLARVVDTAAGSDLEDDESEPPDATVCVYKPIAGERPLDDFPTGTLARREVAAYRLSQETGWTLVPPTVLRDGPFGPGMVQRWIDVDERADVVAMVSGADRRLRRMCVFDVLANNADRKAGHLLPTNDGHVFGVDHGICFAVEPKLRTVLWAWRGQRLNEAEVAIVQRVCDALDGELGAALRELISSREVRATARRAEGLLVSGRFPQPDPYRPAVPWPPF
jgi:uncharacterized repeat protein (TIGR03843 family)